MLLAPLADVFEPGDNEPAQATWISTAGTPQAHTIHERSDVDWVRFTLADVSRVVLETSGSAGDTKLWLFHADQCDWSDAIAYDYDSGQGYFSRIEAYLEPGAYRAAVTEEGQNTTIDSYQLSVTATSLADQVDDYEPDNTTSTARPLTPNAASQVHTIHTPQDVDWCTFHVGVASRATLDVAGAAGNVTLRLYGPTDSSRVINYDYGGANIAGSLARMVAFLQPGTYWASVQEYYGRNTIDDYSINLAMVPQSDLQDSYESDNTAATATPIPTDGTPQVHNIHQPADVDWVTYSLTAASRVTIETNGLDGATYLQLYGPDDANRWVASDYSSGTGDFSRVVAFLDPGRYWVKVTESGQNATIDSYIVSVSSVLMSELEDVYEGDNTWDSAGVLVAGAEPQVHNIHRPTDVDWYRVQLGAASRVILETDGPAGNTWMGLYAAGNLNSPIVSDSYSGNGDFARIVEYVSAGTYYVKVQENGQNDTIDRYTIALQTTPLSDLMDTCEPDDSQGQARTLVFSAAPETHNIHSYRDVDWYKFSLSEGSRVTLETDGPAGYILMRLYRADNLTSPLQSAYSDGDRAASSITAWLDPGTFYVTVMESGQDATIGSYTMSAEAVPFRTLKDPFESDDTSATARAISINGVPEEHNIHRPTDVDWFKFSVSAKSRVTLETDGPEGNTWLGLYASTNLTSPIYSDSYSGNGDFSRIVQYLSAGQYYAKVQENGQNATIARYAMRVQVVPLTSLWDAKEPDDTPSTLSPLITSDGTPQLRSLHEPADADWARFTLDVPSKVVVQTDGSEGATEMWLYGPNNWTSQLAHDSYAGKGDFSRVVADLQAGTYYVKVIEYGQNAAIDTYSISVFAVPQSDPRDRHESDGMPESAVLVPTDGARFFHNFHNATDVDWIKFQVAERSQVVVQTDGAEGDTELWLFAEGSYDWSRPLKRDDDGGYGSFSRIVAYLEPGLYYAATAEYGKNNTIADFTLAVTATALSSLADPREVPGDDTASAANVLALGATTQAHSLHEPTDVDWFRFQVAVPSLVTMTTSGSPSQDYESIRLQLYGPDNSTTSVDYATGSGANCKFQEVLQPGTYFLAVREYYGDQIVPQYMLLVTGTPLGDLKVLSGSVATTGPVGLGETVSVQWTVRNLGPGTTDPDGNGYSSWSDEVYLSLDDKYDSNDRYLSYWSRGSDPLDPQDVYTAYRVVTIPSDTSWAGRSAYLIVVADEGDYLDETDETNNILAIPIQTSRHVALENFYAGRFVDTHHPVEFRWLALDGQPDAVVNLAIDTDADPLNGGYQWLLRDQPVSGQRSVESATLMLSQVQPREEPYYVWAQVSDAAGSQYSTPVAVLVADRAYVSQRGASYAVGGSSYTVAGIEAARLGNTYYVRVRTNFRPDGGSGGDLHIVSGNTTYGLCVNSHTIADGSKVYAGDLYAGAQFLYGTHVHSVPTFIGGYVTRITQKSTVQVLETWDKPWDYEILATFDADALGVEGALSDDGSGEGDDGGGFSAGWSMYCGNDTDRVEVPEEKPDLRMAGFSFDTSAGTASFRYAISGKALTGASALGVYWAAGARAQDIRGGPVFQAATAVAIGSYGPITVPASALGNRPAGCTHLIAMADFQGGVEESNEDNNWAAAPVTLQVKLLSLEATEDIDILDEQAKSVIPDMIWKRNDNASTTCYPMADGISGPGLAGIMIKATFASNLGLTQPIRVHYSFSGPASVSGNEYLTVSPTDLGTYEGVFPLAPPDVIGKYSVTLTFYWEDASSQVLRPVDANLPSLTLYRTFAAPHASGVVSKHANAQQKHLALATDFASGKTSEEEAMQEIMHRVYGLGWVYQGDLPMTRAWESVGYLYDSGGAHNASCYYYVYAWQHVGEVLGIQGIDNVPMFPASLIAKFMMEGVSSTQKAGNARARNGGDFNYWVFANHRLGSFRGKYYDVTFDHPATTDLTEHVVAKFYHSLHPFTDHWDSSGDSKEKCRLFTKPIAPPAGAAPGVLYWEYERVSASPGEGSPADGAATTAKFGATHVARGDGGERFQALVVDVDVEGDAGTYAVYGELWADGQYVTAENSHQGGAPAAATFTLASEGVAVASLRFSGEDIRQSGIDGPYTACLYLVDSQMNLLDTKQFDGGTWDHEQFGELSASLTLVDEHPIDDDSDHLFDRLSVLVALELVDDQERLLVGTLSDVRGRLVDSREIRVGGEGGHQSTLNFDGRRIRAAAADGPFFVRVDVEDEGGGILATDGYATQAYVAGQFEAPPARFQDVFAERARDTNGNGLFDVLTIDTHVVVTVAGTYDVVARLCDANGQFVDALSKSASLAAGTRVVSLDFDGRTIRANGHHGPYQIDYIALRPRTESGDGILSVAEDLYTTQAYRAGEFEAVIINPWQNYPTTRDTNADDWVTPIDALVVINYLNLHGAGLLPNPVTSEPSPPPYYDVNGDFYISPADALMVINYLNAAESGEGEGAAEPGTDLWAGIGDEVWPDVTGAELPTMATIRDSRQPGAPVRQLAMPMPAVPVGVSQIAPCEVTTARHAAQRRARHSWASDELGSWSLDLDSILPDILGDVVTHGKRPRV